MPFFGSTLRSLRAHRRRSGGWWALITEEPIRIRLVYSAGAVVVWGFYLDKKKPAIFVFPLPMLGLRIDWPHRDADLYPPFEVIR